MKRVSLLTLVLALLVLVFFILLVFLRYPFPLYPLMSYQDAFDILTPLALIPVYWLLFRDAGLDRPSRAGEMAFLLLAVLWVQGQGMHLAANSIDNLIEGLARNQIVDVKPTDIYRLTLFLDEYLSHYLWHIGMLGLAALLIYREWRRPAILATDWRAAIPAGIIYGFCHVCISLEANTVPLGLPFAALVVLFGLISERKRFAERPVLAFFFVACLFASLAFAGWGLYWGGFPPPSGVGLI